MKKIDDLFPGDLRARLLELRRDLHRHPELSLKEERTAKRERLAAVLALNVGLVGRFKASVAILTPLLGSLVGLLLK